LTAFIQHQSTDPAKSITSADVSATDTLMLLLECICYNKKVCHYFRYIAFFSFML